MWNTHANAYSHRISHSHLYSDTNGYCYIHSNTDRNGHIHADTYCDSDIYANANSDGRGDSHSNSHGHVHSDPDSNSYSHTHAYTNGDSHTDAYANSHSHANAYSNGDSHTDTHTNCNGHAYSHTNAYLSDDYLESTEPSLRDRGHLLQSHHYSQRRYFSLFVPSRKRQPAAVIDAKSEYWRPFRDAHFVRQLYVHNSGDRQLCVYWHTALPHRCPLSPATLPKGTVGTVVHTDHAMWATHSPRFS